MTPYFNQSDLLKIGIVSDCPIKMTSTNPFNQGYYSSRELREFGFQHVGENVSVAKNMTIIGVENISLANNIRIDGNTVIAVHAGALEIGNNVHIGNGCFLGCVGGVSLLEFSGLSQNVSIYSGSDDYSGETLSNPTVPDKYRNVKVAPVIIKRHVIVGSGSIILPGVTIGEGSSIGALSLVTKSLKEWGVYCGVPVRRLKDRSKQLLRLEDVLRNEEGQRHSE